MPRSNPTDIQHLVESVTIAEQNLLVKKIRAYRVIYAGSYLQSVKL